jgi:hypothetical protein
MAQRSTPRPTVPVLSPIWLALVVVIIAPVAALAGVVVGQRMRPRTTREQLEQQRRRDEVASPGGPAPVCRAEVCRLRRAPPIAVLWIAKLKKLRWEPHSFLRTFLHP